MVERVISCKATLDAPFDDGAYAVQASRHAVLGTYLLDIAADLVLVKHGIHVNILVLLLQPEFEISYVICRDGVNAKMEAPLVHDLMAETLVTEYLVEIVKMMFPALERERGLVNIFLYLV